MKREIWKYELQEDNITDISMPQGAEILTVQIQNGSPHIWALVDTEAEREYRTFETLATGDLVSENPRIERKYIGTFQMRDGRLVYHLFERIKK